MMMGTPRVGFALSRVAVVTCLVLFAGTAGAQPCADPDGDGDITQADGVITLEAAAGLTNECSLTTCDINTDGVIDDTDAVLVFRKAADLAVEENCLTTSSEPVDQRVVILLQQVLPFLLQPFRFVPQIGGLPVPDPNDPTIFDCDNFGDGDVTIEADDFETLVSFFDCLFGNAFFDGDISDGDDGFIISLTVLDQISDDEVTYDAESLLVSDLGTGLRISGLIVASPFFNLPSLEDADDFELSLFALEITPEGMIRAGQATLDLVETGLPDLRRIVLDFDGTNIAIVTVTDDAFGEEIFLYDFLAERFL